MRTTATRQVRISLQVDVDLESLQETEAIDIELRDSSPTTDLANGVIRTCLLYCGLCVGSNFSPAVLGNAGSK